VLSSRRPFRLLASLSLASISFAACQTSPGSDAQNVVEEPEPQALRGVADFHLHMFAEEAFGGGWFHGEHEGHGHDLPFAECDGGQDHGRLSEDLQSLLLTQAVCGPQAVGQLAAELDETLPDDQKGPFLALMGLPGSQVAQGLGMVPGLREPDTGAHRPLDGPKWNTIAHHQAWGTYLHDAYEAGLRLQVVSAVSYDWLCKAIPEELRVERNQECDEMADIYVQLEMANDFAADHAWAEVAKSAADARRIITEGKLALVLSVEASHILEDYGDDWMAGFERLYEDYNVRTLQPVHQLDNRFAGAAPHNPFHHVFQYLENCHVDHDCALTNGAVTLGFDVEVRDGRCVNTVGLKEDGKQLLEAMMSRGMVMDAAHLSEQALRDLHGELAQNNYYPFYLSHAHFREMMLPSKQHEEKTTPWWVAKMLRETGGMIGLRTAHEEVNTYEGADVSNDCHGSSKSFAQYLAYGTKELGVDVAFGADFNGFIQQTRPRFGPDACSASFPEEGQCQARAQEEADNRLGTAFDESGLAHTGLLMDLVDDLDQLGADVEPLMSSAQRFVEMWERAEKIAAGGLRRKTPVESTSDLEAAPLGAIEVMPDHQTRKAALESCE